MKIKIIFLSGLMLGAMFLGIFKATAQSNTLDASSKDAVAIRIVPNYDFLSISQWYQAQNFKGSPQAMLVDGYEAIRDNRTVYVAATNLVTGSVPQVYFNIYIITYNENADNNTTDIFGKILSTWKFNSNLVETSAPHCSLPLKKCLSDSDCLSGYTCFGSNDEHVGVCQSPVGCTLDSDCGPNYFCDSQKAKLIRDIKRLGTLNTYKVALDNYRNRYGKFPVLNAGTYLPQAVISTWPSWQTVFNQEVGVALADPVNKLGVCSDKPEVIKNEVGWDEASCYQVSSKSFYNGTNSRNLTLPAGSLAMAYTVEANGKTYNLCANMEGNFEAINADGSRYDLSLSNCPTTGLKIGASGNQAPTLVSANLQGYQGQEFKGYVKFKDPEGQAMTVSLDSSSVPWTSYSFSGAPTLKNTSDPNQKIIYFSKAGSAGSYQVKLIITDSLGASYTTILNINISGSQSVITASDATYYLSADPSKALDYNLYFRQDDLSRIELSVGSTISTAVINNSACQTISGKGTSADPWLPGINTPCANINNGLKLEISRENNSNVMYRLHIYGNLLPTTLFNGNKTINYHLNLRDGFNAISGSRDFKINIKPNPPKLDIKCPTQAGFSETYSCAPTNLNPANYNTRYSFEGLPPGLSGNVNTGVITGAPSQLGDFNIKIKALDDYGAQNEISFKLKIIDQCGISTVKFTGGPWDEGGDFRTQGGYYKTVKIGSQCWLADSINVPNMVINKKTIPLGACYGDQNDYCEAYGRLYSESEVSDAILCPVGYRIARDSDWGALEKLSSSQNYSCASGCPNGYTCDSNTQKCFKCNTSRLNAWDCDPAGQFLKGTGDSGFNALLGGYVEKGYLGQSTRFVNLMKSVKFLSYTPVAGVPGHDDVCLPNKEIFFRTFDLTTMIQRGSTSTELLLTECKDGQPVATSSSLTDEKYYVRCVRTH